MQGRAIKRGEGSGIEVDKCRGVWEWGGEGKGGKGRGSTMPGRDAFLRVASLHSTFPQQIHPLTLYLPFSPCFPPGMLPLQVSSLRRYHRKYVCHQDDCACEEDLQTSVTQHFASLVSALHWCVYSTERFKRVHGVLLQEIIPLTYISFNV